MRHMAHGLEIQHQRPASPYTLSPDPFCTNRYVRAGTNEIP